VERPSPGREAWPSDLVTSVSGTTRTVYPVGVSLNGRPCLVVGGGSVALRKVRGLLEQGAVVTVVAPQVSPAMEELAQSGAIDLQRRAYVAGEARRFSLVFAATDDRGVNREVSGDARQAQIWVNVADDPERCTFHLPARVQRGSLQIALFSDGRAPFATRRLKQCLERRFAQEWARWVQAAARFRKRVKALHLTSQQEEVLFDTFFDATVDASSLTSRVPSASEEDTWLGTVEG